MKDEEQTTRGVISATREIVPKTNDESCDKHDLALTIHINTRLCKRCNRALDGFSCE